MNLTEFISPGVLNFSSHKMDDALSLVCSALLISIVVWLLNPLAKLHTTLNYLFRGDTGSHANRSVGVRSFEEMPGPQGLPFFGDLINYVRKAEFKPQMMMLQTSFEEYGPIFKSAVMGKTVVFIQDPRDVEIVFKADGKYPVRPGELAKIAEWYRTSRNLPKNLIAL